MHRPQLLILDEPTSALDPLIRNTVFAELRAAVGEGRTVLFSSHSLSEVEELCDEVIILRNGEIVEQKKMDDLKEKALRRVRIVFSSMESVPAAWPSQMNVLTSKGPLLEGTWTGKSDELIQWLSTQVVADVIIEKPDLSDLFLTYYQETGTGA